MLVHALSLPDVAIAGCGVAMRTVDAALGGVFETFAILTVSAEIGPLRTVGSEAGSSRRIRLPIRTDIPGSQTIGLHGAIRIHRFWPAGRMATPFFDWRSMINT
jgi:hypothetical protein